MKPEAVNLISVKRFEDIDSELGGIAMREELLVNILELLSAEKKK